MSVKHTLCLMTKSPATRDELEAILLQQENFRLVEQDAPELGLVIIELGRASDNDFELIPRLMADERVGEIFVTARQKDPDLILQAMRAGVSEYLSKPFVAEEIANALAGYAERHRTRATVPPVVAKPTGGRLLHVMGAKGGIGATTIVVNLGLHAMRSNGNAAVLDMRLPQGDVPLMLDMQYAHTWADGVRTPGRLDATFLRSLAETHSSGLDVLAAPDAQDDIESLTAPNVSALLRIMRSVYSVTVVDGGPYADELALASMREADTILLVTDLALPALAGARRLLDDIAIAAPTLRERIKLVVNRLCPKSGVDVGEAERLLECPVYGSIDDDYGTAVSAINQGKSLLEVAPRSPATKSFTRLAERLLPDPKLSTPATGAKSSFLARFMKRDGNKDTDTFPGAQMLGAEG